MSIEPVIIVPTCQAQYVRSCRCRAARRPLLRVGQLAAVTTLLRLVEPAARPALGCDPRSPRGRC